MSPGITFERVYLALKEQLGSGRYAAGEHLEPSALSGDLNASVTPVRDALHRLVGEGLVEAPRGDGFRTPIVTEVGLRHLYRWNAVLLDLGARASAAPVETNVDSGSTDIVTVTDIVFRAIAGFSANPEHAGAVERMNERLRPMRRIEVGLVAEPGAEMARLEALLNNSDRRPLRYALGAYHRKRERLAAEIVERLHRQ